jgi:4-hydroxy-tetrahydrodipicolinate reductase
MKVALAGAGGRMGRTLIDAVLADRELTLACAFDVPGSAAVGTKVGSIAIGADAAAAAQCDVLIDFTRPEGTLANLKHARAMVIGTTGFSAAQRKTITEAAQRVPIVMAANFAVGVNAAYKLAESAARILGERPAKEIGFHAIRGGDIVGEHTVLFISAGERVEITVRSQSRTTYAMGALRAAKWLRGKAPGLYDMYDVLGLR